MRLVLEAITPSQPELLRGLRDFLECGQRTSSNKTPRQRAKWGLILELSRIGPINISAALEDRLRQHRALVVVLLCVVCVARVIPDSRAKPFWHDESYTILMSRLPSLGAIWQAGLDGVDLSPPLNLWPTRGVHMVAGVGYLQTRLPPLLGFLTMVLALFALLWRRTGSVAALSGALVPFVTAALRFAFEARAYGVMMGLSALSLYAWMEAADGRRRHINVPLLGLALAASIWNQLFRPPGVCASHCR